MLLSTSSSYAAKIHLTQYEGSKYLLEVSDISSYDTTTKTLNKIAKEVKKNGYNKFLIPPANQMGKSTCYIILSNAKTEDIKPLAEAYQYKIWDVRSILKK